MKHKLVMVMLSVALVASLVFVGCAKPAPAPTPAPTPTPTPTPTPAPVEKVYKWRMQSHYAPTEIQYAVTIADFVDRVERMSNGRIDIELYPAGALVPSTEILTSLAKGVFEISGGASSYWSGMMPETLSALFPMGPRNADDLAAIWYGGLGDLFRDSYAEQGVYLLTTMQSDLIPLLSTKPIESVKDFEGLSIRTHGATAMLVEELGASTTFIPGEEVYMALSLGTVDAATWVGPSSLYNWKWYEVAKYLVYPALITAFQQEDLMVNMDVWQELPDDLKAILQTAADAAYFENRVTQLGANDEALAKMQKEGLEVCQLPASDVDVMTKAAEVVWLDIASKSPKAKEAIKIITDYCREQGYTDFKID